jgi:hypothetical protein
MYNAYYKLLKKNGWELISPFFFVHDRRAFSESVLGFLYFCAPLIRFTLLKLRLFLFFFFSFESANLI